MKRLLIYAVVMTFALPAQAGMVEHADRVHQSQQNNNPRPQGVESIRTWVQDAEKTVSAWWSGVKGRIAGETTKPTQTVERIPASQETLPKTTNETTEQAKTTTTQGDSTSTTQVPVTAAVGSTAEQTETAEMIRQTKQELAAKPVTQVATPGRAGDATLPKTKFGVPSLPLFTVKDVSAKKGSGKISKKDKERIVKVKVDKIPLMDVGLEKTISASDFVGTSLVTKLSSKTKVTELASPKLTSQSEINKTTMQKIPLVAKATPPKSKDYELGSMVSVQKIEAVPLNMELTKPLEALKPTRPYSDDELKMISAVFTFQKGDKCHVAIGMFHDLSTKKEFAEEANFYLGVCAHQVGFHTEAVSRLVSVIRGENPDYTTEAIQNVVEDLPREFDKTVSSAILAVKNQKLLPENARDAVQFVLARASYEEKNYTQAISSAEQVNEKSKHYAQARYILGISEYASNQAKKAEATLTSLRTWMEKSGKTDKNLMALIASNVARMRFNQGRFQAAHEEYMKIPKDHPIWVDALVEQGWTQLNIDDAAGAIGNMYSLHSPYFKSVFMPESWVVRTLGYIDICQYGDAYRSLTKLEHMSKSQLDKVRKYRELNKTSEAYYQTVKNYLIGRSDSDINGLPSQVIREIARQRGFLNAQSALNQIEDEIGQYEFIYGLLKKDIATINWNAGKAQERLTKIKADLKQAKVKAELVKFVNEWQAAERQELNLLAAYKYQSKLYEDARKDFLRMKAGSFKKIEVAKGNLRKDAGRELMGHLKDLQVRVEQILEGNEFLRYEIFSGSGENIRYQVAGGTVAEGGRVPSHIKPQKILNWEFDGEYWEDEIGSYRSTLKNNCPNNRRSTAGTASESEQKTASRF